MITVSNEKIQDFRITAENYMRLHAGKFSKFLYVVEKMLKQTRKAADEYNDELQYLNLQYAEKDQKGFAVVEKFTRKVPGGKGQPLQEIEDERYRYSAAKAKELHEAKRALLAKEVQIEEYERKGDLLEFIPADMDFHLWQFFAPFVLPEDVPEEVFDKLVARTSGQ